MTNSELKAKILEKINKSGFPLELRIADFLQRNGYYVASNLYYLDQDENKGREVDLRGLKNLFLKYYLEQPSSETSYDKELFDLDCAGFAEDVVWFEEEVYDALEAIHPFATNKKRGRGHFEPLKEPFKGEGSETIFKAITTAVKATIATRDAKFGADTGSICFYYPVVVFDGMLYESYLDNGVIHLSETEMVFVSFFYTSAKYKEEQFIVPVVTEQGLSEFCAALDRVQALFGNFLNDRSDMFAPPPQS